jgi:hypothetical protein
MAAMRDAEKHMTINRFIQQLEEWNEAAETGKPQAAKDSKAIGETRKED